ncbi:MAG: oligosaccharide flippase family protein [Anaerolineales bacterium]|nr:oligosaccharide flippase family protein [Anaerolineales bacterium]
MRDLVGRLFKMVIGYGAIQWAGPFLSLIFTPIITRFLDPSDYGIADYVTTIIAAVSAIAMVSMPVAILTHFNDRPEDMPWRRAITGSALTFAVISGVAFGAAIFSAAPYIAERVTFLIPYVPILRFIGVTFALGLTAPILIICAQAALRVRWGMVFSAVAIIGTIVGNVLFIVVLQLGATGMLLTPILVSTSVTIAALIMMRRLIGRPQSGITQMLLRAGVILLPSVIATWTMQMSDRLFLATTVTTTALGYYAIAGKMASLVFVVIGPITNSWTPLTMAVQNEEDAQERYVSLSRYLIAAVMLVSLGVGLFANEILIVLTRPAYLPASPYVGYLTLTYVFTVFGFILSTGALMGKQLSSVSGAAVVAAVVNLTLNAIMIPVWGVWGAVWATVLSYGIHQIILYAILLRRHPVPYPVGRILAALVLLVALITVGLWVPPICFPYRVGIKLIIYAMLPLGLILVRLIQPQEVHQLLMAIRAGRRSLHAA